jgi:hypothetical protein
MTDVAAPDVFTELSKAIEARLRLAFAADKWHFEIVPDPMTVQEFERLTGMTPMLALAWRKFTQSAQGRAPSGDVTMGLTVIVKNQAGRPGRFYGDALGPGLFPAVRAAITMLHGYSVGGNCGTIDVGEAAMTYAEGAANMALAMARIEMTCFVKFPPETAEDFLRHTSTFEAPEIPDAALPQLPQNVRP